MKSLIKALAVLLVVGTANAKVIYVDDNASEGGDGTSWASAHKYLQDALADVNASDEIWVAEGTYKPDQGAGITEGNRTVSFNLVNGVGMYGGFKGRETTRTPLGDGNQTILSGEINADKTFWSLNVVSGVDLDGNTTLNGFRITKGNANGYGYTPYGNSGGMYLKNSSPTLINCVFSGNSAGRDGGGMGNNGGSPTLTNCTFTDNSASGRGGGMYNSGSSPTLTNCVFTSNSAGGGAGMYNSSSSPTLTNCVFSGNSASASGGGMGNTKSFPTLTNCVFTGNSADIDGAGMYNSSSSPTLTNCVFTGNSGFGRFGSGAGMYNSSSSPTLIDCTFTDNSAVRLGGGMFNTDNSSPTLTNCVFSSNSASDNGGGMYNSGSSPTLINCVFSGNSANYGGGMCNNGGSPTLTNCVFTGNSGFGGLGAGGGGMYNNGSSPTLTNCNFTDNSADSDGGGMGNNRGSPTLTNCNFTDNSAGRDGGGMWNYESSPILTNCVFSGNSAGDGGGMYTHGYYSPTLINCVFSGNSADSGGGGMYNYGPAPPTLTNCILWKNLTNGSEGHGIYGDSWRGIVLEEAVAPQFPGDPNAKDRVLGPPNIAQGWTGDGRAISVDPLFKNPDNPIGPDGKWFTADDGLRLKDGSPAIDAGYNASLPADTNDLDGDDNKTELTPYDLLGRNRLVGTAVDLGPYEFDPANPPLVIVKTHLVGVSATMGGSAIGGGDVEEGKPTTLTATTNTGYLFTGWSGDAAGTTNPLPITVDAAKNITANFAQDLSDEDGDGLSNYAELVTYGTDKTKADTDGDGLTDKQEIDRGWNANSSDKAVIDAVMEMMGATSSSTPYTEGWFYYPNRGWMYTKRSIYPYFYDSSTKAWMYFKSGEDKPRFYHYGTKAWVTLGE
jgi:uncharacterized repeat protein (TIGR02543 family)